MQIVQVVREFSEQGGIENVAFELHKAWRNKGLDARVLSSVARHDAAHKDVDRVWPILGRIPTRGRWRYVGRLPSVILFTAAATAQIRRLDHRAVVLSHGDTLAGDVCVIHSVNKASLVNKMHAGSYRWLLNPMHLWVGLRDRWMIGGLRFRRFICVSASAAHDLIAHYGVPSERITVIPNGVNIDRFTPVADDRVQTRRRLGLPSNAPLLLFVGHEFSRKGLDRVISAMRHLKPDARLLVVGSDNPVPYRKKASAIGVGERVIFLGTRSDVPALYRAADVFVFPTYYEAFPLVCLEAMASGLPLFATEVGGIREYLRDGVNGCSITRDPADIGAKLARALANPGWMQHMGQKARATAEEFSWSVIAERYKYVLQEVAAERDRQRRE